MTPNRWLVAALLSLAALRLWFTGTLDLAPEESYYYQWSLHPALGYASTGPANAAAIWLGTHIAGPTEFGVRLLAPMLSLGTSLLIFCLARRLYSEPVAIWSVVAVNVMPGMQISSVTMTADPLSTFLWAAALYTFWRAVETSQTADAPLHGRPLIRGWNMWWPATGATLGLGFLCKWTSLLQLASMVLLLSSGTRFRRHFRSLGFWGMLAVFLLFLVPTLLWNLEHEWATWTHLGQGVRWEEPARFFSGESFGFLAAHAGFYSPLLFCAMLASLWREFARARNHLKPRFLLAFTLPFLGLSFVLSLSKSGAAHWSGPAFLAATILTTADWLPRARQSATVRRFMGASLGLGLVLSVLILNIDLLRAWGFALPAKLNPTQQFHGWHTLAETAEQVRVDFEKSTGTPVFLIASGREIASEIGFYLRDKRREFPDHPPVYTPESQAIEDQYSFWPRYDANIPLQPGQKHPDALYTEEAGFNPFHGRTALFLTDSDASGPPSAITSAFQKSELIASFDIVRHGDKIRKLRIFACTNYQGRAL